ncbi:MAG: DUF4315 family protein [Clostridia bacterium]|nr:DUF4315 family protein [Clostridia bacterium]
MINYAKSRKTGEISSFCVFKEENSLQNKLTKIKKDIQRTEVKITEYQSKLKSLQKEKTDLENLMMIDVLRKHKVNHNDLPTILQIFEEEKGSSVPLKINNTEEQQNEKI